MDHPKIITKAFLSRLKGKEILLFLSATPIREKYYTLPYDFVILNNEHFATNVEDSQTMYLYGDKVIVMNFHNYIAIKLLRELAIKISAFVGIDAYQHHLGECFNSVSFFSKLGPILNPIVHYITDPIYVPRDDGNNERGFLTVNYEVFDEVDRKFMNQDSTKYFVDFFNDLFDVTCIIISKIVERRSIVELHGRTFSKTTGNIFDHINEYPCLIIEGLTKNDLQLLITNDNERYYSPLAEDFNSTIVELLARAQKQKWNSIGVSINTGIILEEFFEAWKDWDSEYPNKLDFYLINPNL